MTNRASKDNLFPVVSAAREFPGSDSTNPEAASAERRADGHNPHRDQHLIEVPADLLRDMAMLAQNSNQTATALRDWIVDVMLQMSDVARDGITHLDRDEIEVARFILAFIANAPKRLGLASEGRHA